MRCSVYSTLVFLSAMFVGAVFALLSIKYGSISDQFSKWRKSRELPVYELYREKLKGAGIKQVRGYRPKYKVVPEADYLKSTVKLLCWVVLNGQGAKENPWDMPNMMTAHQAINETWARHCDKTLFFTNNRNHENDAIKLKSPDLESWAATYEILTHIASKGYLDQYDWFVKAEEDTYIIIENLLYYLSVRNSTEPTYLGHAYINWELSYNVAGSAYVLSKSAFRKLQTVLVKGQCRPSSAYEDVSLGRCLAELGIRVEDTRDNLGRGRFLMFQPESLLIKGNLPWTESFWTLTKYISPEGPDCCSDYAITFHYIPPNMMYILEYMIYHLKPFGINTKLLLPFESEQTISPPFQDLNTKYQELLKNKRLEKNQEK